VARRQDAATGQQAMAAATKAAYAISAALAVALFVGGIIAANAASVI
jgi:hypothetical protein